MRVIIFILLCSIGCSPTPKSGAAKSTNLMGTSALVQTNTSNTTSATGTAAPIPKVDASTLQILSLSVAPLVGSGTQSQVMNFTASGPTEYVLWQVCPQAESTQTSTCVASSSQACGIGGACVQNVTSYNEVLFPHLFAGQVTITLSACVNPQDALNSSQLCGSPKTILYNSNVANNQVLALFAQRQQLINELNSIGTQEQALYQDYVADLQTCLKADAANAAFYQAKIAVVDGLLNGVFFKMWAWAPQQAIAALSGTPVISGILSAGKTVINGVANTVDKVASSFCAIGTTTGIDTSCLTSLKTSGSTLTTAQQDAYCQNSTATPGAVGKFCSMVSTIGKAIKGMASQMNPVQSLAVLSGAIQTVSNPASAVSQTCLAEQKMAAPLQQLNESAVVYTNQLVSVDSQLQALGEL